MGNNVIMTIDDLAKFCLAQNIQKFNAKESGYSLRVSIPAKFSIAASDEKTLYANIRIFHTGRNKNGSDVTVNAANHCMKTLAYKPLLANFTVIDGEKDFTEHDVKEVVNDDGEKEIVYLERQIGCFTAKEPYMEYDEETDRHYVYGEVAIPREYTPAAEIIERRKGTDVSAELDIYELSVNAKDGIVILNDAELSGCTCLGAAYEPGMHHACILLGGASASFSKKEEEGGGQMSKLDELLKTYGKTKNDITFDYSGMSDEELEARFRKEFGDGSAGSAVKAKHAGNYSLAFFDGQDKCFSLTLSEIDDAIYRLVNGTYAQKDDTWYHCDVYSEDSYVIFTDMQDKKKSYRQSYEKNGDVFSLMGERIEVMRIWVTKEENDALEKLKASYSSALSELESYKKKEILESGRYSSIMDADEVKELLDEKNKEKFASLSSEELLEKLNGIVVDYVSKGKFNFAAVPSGKNTHAVALPVDLRNGSDGNKNPYGDLFKKYKD